MELRRVALQAGTTTNFLEPPLSRRRPELSLSHLLWATNDRYSLRRECVLYYASAVASSRAFSCFDYSDTS